MKIEYHWICGKLFRVERYQPLRTGGNSVYAIECIRDLSTQQYMHTDREREIKFDQTHLTNTHNNKV